MGVTAFSFTEPLTRYAVVGDGMSALFVGSARSLLASVLAIVALRMTNQRLPTLREGLSIAVVAVGAVLGFPLLTSFASLTTPSSHSAAVIAILPAVTALIASLRTRDYPPVAFWIATVLGAMSAVVFSLLHQGMHFRPQIGDLLLFAAVILCALGYSEGGIASKTLGSWQTISWGLIFALPVVVPLTVFTIVNSSFHGSATQWLSFVYLSVVSMFLGFIAWYRGLAIGPMPQVSQVQLIQPVLSIVWSAAFLAETISATTIIGAVLVVSFSLVAVRVKNRA